METLVEMESISKSFGSLSVLRDVSFSLARGSTHALMGENGAGKSTLMKILSGVHHQTAGSVSVRGQEVNLRSPQDARHLGISTIFQEFTLIPNLTVAENMFLGHEPLRRDGSIDRNQMVSKARSILSEVFPSLDATQIVEKLTVAQQQEVEIAKGLTANADIFIFDEPTAALNSADVEHLFKVIRGLKDQGKGIVYISHRMKEVFELSDMITVMKDGALMRTAPTREFNIDSLVSTMVGRELQSFFPPRSAGILEDLLVVNNVQLRAKAEKVSLSVRKGEILGLAGLEGQGQREIMRAIVGVEHVPGTEVERLDKNTGKLIPVEVSKGFRAAIDAGIGFIPEDRKLEGLFLTLSIFDNIALGKQLNKPLFSRAWRKIADLREMIGALRISASDPNNAVGRLSGGNQQKVLLARWLLSGVDILVIEEPTRGVDVGAKAEIYRLLREFTDGGGAVIVSSRELVELIGLCDNLLVIHDQNVVARVPAEGASEESVLGAALKTSRITILSDTFPSEGDNPIVKAGTYAKKGPYRIGHSHYGLAGSTHTFQTAYEAEYEVKVRCKDKISEYLFHSADLDPSKQAADIEDLLAQNVDALIIAPLTSGSAVIGIQKAKMLGIPTVVYLGRVNTSEFTVQVQGDDFFFGRIMAEFLVEKLGNKGNVWMFRGVEGHPIATDRYSGAMEAFLKSDVTITSSQFGSWSYEKTKKIAADLYRSDPSVAGVWTDGANMSLAVLDALQEAGAIKIPLITGEALNGWMHRWHDDKMCSIGPICPPALSTAALRAALALLEGREMPKNWTNRPTPITDSTLDKFYRPDLNDSYWAPSEMPDNMLQNYFKKASASSTDHQPLTENGR